MSKRPCPFEANCAPQIKVHISDEDVDKQNENYMQSMYEKTIGKLFQGANNNNNVNTNSPQPQQVSKPKNCLECKSTTNPVTASCWFCEISLCQSCVKICNFCCENFCFRCTVAIFKHGNNYTCLTCYN